MATPGNKLKNRISGETITWLETAATTGGAYLKVRFDVAPLGYAAAEHIHPEQDEHFDIIEGSMEVLLNGERRMVHAGGSITVPKGAAHQWWNRSETKDLVMNVTFEPALNTELMFEQVWGLVNVGKCKPDGAPRLVDALMMMYTYHIYLAGAPVWLQKLISFKAGLLGPLFGYRKFRPEFSPDNVNARMDTPSIKRIAQAAIVTIAMTFGMLNHLQAQQQFVDHIIGYSSEFQPSNENCTNGWAACRIIGEPDVYPEYGDLPGAWAPATSSTQREYLILGYADPMQITAVNIYETYYGGSVDTVYLRDASTGSWHMAWSGTAAYADPVSRIHSIIFPITTYYTDAVRLALNSPLVGGYNNIDAVSIGASIAGLGEMDRETVRIYPNPSTGAFSVEVPGQRVQRVRVRDLAGRVMQENFTPSATMVHIDLELPGGVHILEILTERGSFTARHFIE